MKIQCIVVKYFAHIYGYNTTNHRLSSGDVKNGILGRQNLEGFAGVWSALVEA